MKQQPSDWELQILPYLSNELSDAERKRFEAHLEEDPAFAEMVSEFRETMKMVGRSVPPASALSRLEGLETRIYREIAARTARRRRRFLGGGEGAPFREWWRTLMGGLVVATASVAIGIVVGMREVEPTPYTPVAEMKVVVPTRPASLEGEPHQKFIQSELERQLNEARIIHHVRGNPQAALARYAKIVEDNPQSWTSRVAEFEQSALLSSIETIQPLLREETKPVFTDVASR